MTAPIHPASATEIILRQPPPPSPFRRIPPTIIQKLLRLTHTSIHLLRATITLENTIKYLLQRVSARAELLRRHGPGPVEPPSNLHWLCEPRLKRFVITTTVRKGGGSGRDMGGDMGKGGKGVNMEEEVAVEPGDAQVQLDWVTMRGCWEMRRRLVGKVMVLRREHRGLKRELALLGS